MPHHCHGYGMHKVYQPISIRLSTPPRRSRIPFPLFNQNPIKMKLSMFKFALASLLLCLTALQLSATPNGDPEDPQKGTITFMGQEFEIEGPSLCVELQCGQEIVSNFNESINAFCQNIDQSDVDDFVNQARTLWCNLNTACCPTGQPCFSQCGVRNVAWTCENGILNISFQLYSRCRAF